MEELFNENVKTDEQNGDILTPELLDVVADVIMESKKSGCIKSSVLLERFDKFQASAAQFEEIYKMLDNQGVQVVEEYEKDKDLLDQLLKEISMDDPVKMYLKDIGKVPLLISFRSWSSKSLSFSYSSTT